MNYPNAYELVVNFAQHDVAGYLRGDVSQNERIVLPSIDNGPREINQSEIAGCIRMVNHQLRYDHFNVERDSYIRNWFNPKNEKLTIVFTRLNFRDIYENCSCSRLELNS